MSDAKILLPPAPEHPLLDRPDEDRLQREVESLRKQLEEEKKRNQKEKNEPKRPNRRTLWIISLLLLAAVVLALVAGLLPHFLRERRLRKDAQAEAAALPVITYISAERSPADTQLVLPGSIEAITEAPILARADGYVKKRYVDIGDRVKAGQLLAEITAPELDQQVEQARAKLLQARAALRQSSAALQQARANQALAKVTAERWATLLKRGAVSPQDNDTHQADYQAQTANVAAMEEAVAAAQQNVLSMQANLDRLLELQGYEQVRAPFSGVITLRNVDDGALISTGQTLLFRIAQTDRLRTYIYVPESNAPLVQTGQSAKLAIAEYPGREFIGQITRTSSALDPATRTLVTEVQVANTSGTLAPGMFSEVSLNSRRTNPPVLIPADALIIRSNGAFVAVLQGEAPAEVEEQASGDDKSGQNKGTKDGKGGKAGKNQKQVKKEKNDRKDKAALEKQQQQLPTFTVHLVPVSIGRDYGNAVEILTGLNGGERVVESPNDHVEENAQVKGQKAKENPVNAESGPGGKQNANSEQLNPQPGAEPAPKQPAKERMNRGPGH